jgi:hypothetical protein
MLRPDQPADPAEQPDGANPDSVYRAYLSADARPAIRAATAGQVHGILTTITWHLCDLLADPPPGLPRAGSGSRPRWQVCQVGAGLQAGLQVYCHVQQAVAGRCLGALGFDPDRATTESSYYAACVSPFLRAARTQRMRCSLLLLADLLAELVLDSNLAVGVSMSADLPPEAWEAGTGIRTATQLYRHAVRITAAHILFYLWRGHEAEHPVPDFRPFTGIDFSGSSPN